ncbi:hypothetical protein HDV06_002380 [Boothiomyces sp. JEL0866]|nr:hypothetical protein HDV06_002380 [Boothiomyces sp. JEL0866]
MSLVFQSAWLSSRYCTGPPTTMVLFNPNNGTLLYYFEESNYILPYCGLSTFALDTGCCISSEDVTLTSGYNSFTQNDFVDQTSAPKAANSFSYCSIASNSNSSLWGYNEMFFLAGNECHEQNIMCDGAGLMVYNDSSCKELIEQYAISTVETPVTSNSLGNVSIKTTVFTSGQIEFSYTCYQPSTLNIPNYRDSPDYFTTTFYTIGVLVSLTTLFISIRNYCRKAKKSTMFMIISQTFWAIRSITKMYTTLSIYNYAYLYFYYLAVLSEISSLCSVWLNVMLFFQLYKQWNSYRIVGFLVVILLHFGLVGLWYIAVFIPIIDGVYLYEIEYMPYSIWFFSFPFIDVIVPTLLYFKIKTKCKSHVASLSEKVKEKYDQVFRNTAILLIVQVINASISGTIELLQYNTNFFDTDKLNYMATSTTTMLVSIHSAMFVKIYDNLTYLTYTLIFREISAGPQQKLKMLKDVVSDDKGEQSVATAQLASTRIEK